MSPRRRASLFLAASLSLVLLDGCGGSDSDALPASSGESPAPAQLALNSACLDQLLIGGQLVVVSDITITNGATLGVSVSGGTLDLGGLQVTGKANMAPRDGVTASPEDSSCPSAEDVDYLYIEAPGLPDHDTGTFPNAESPYAISAQTRSFRVPAHPTLADTVTALSTTRFDGVLLNGVPVMMREPYCATDVNCSAWHVNPLHEPSWFGIDSHNAHTLSDGSYHYHGDPKTLYDDTAPAGATVIGTAADGFPIFGPWFNDDGLVRKATSSYTLNAGERPSPSFPFAAPSGPWTGEYLEDYSYLEGSGDLDECNGMTLEGVYGYFVTDDFPYLMHCLKGTPDPSFDLAP